MQDLITQLTEAIYAEQRSGRPLPARIELPPEDFERFQREHREALAAQTPEVENLYPDSLAGVPVVPVVPSSARTAGAGCSCCRKERHPTTK